MLALSFFTRLLQGRGLDPAEVMSYRDVLSPLTEQLAALYIRWRKDLEIDSSAGELANATAIQRWEAAGLLDRVRAIRPPQPLARWHVDLESILADTARASQLLSNGYRFHSSRARCDGHALMLSAEERLETLIRLALERGLELNADPRQDTITAYAELGGAPADA